jgi:hypothetical protein
MSDTHATIEAARTSVERDDQGAVLCIVVLAAALGVGDDGERRQVLLWGMGVLV